MKIPEIINNRYVKNFGLFTLLSIPIVAAQLSHDNKVIEKAQTEIKAKDPQRFARLKEINKNKKMSKFDWQRERKAMNDSIRIDSIAKKAYFEGAQMVRDSIANAQ